MPARVPVRILERGRVTIPADVREELDLEPGDRAWIEVEPIESEEWKGGGPIARLQDGE